MRDPSQVASEFLEDRQPYAVFIDNNLGSKPDYLRALCDALRPIEKIWSAAVSIDVTDDPSLIRAMALAGCTGVFVGFESLADQNLADARKKTPKTADYARRVQILHDNGIQVNGSFVLGFDHDRKDVFARTADWVEENRLECATFHILTPYPATPLFRQMEGEGRLLHRDWSRYDTAHAVFRPKHMEPEELEQGYGWLLRATVLAHVDLETPSRRLARGGSVSRHVVSVQALKSLLASVDPASSGPRCLEAIDRAFPNQAFALPTETGSMRDGGSGAE